MSGISRQMLDVAMHLIEFEGKGNHPPEPGYPAAYHVCEKLRPQLATLMGKVGFRALLSRALAVAGAEVSWLGALQVMENGSLGGWSAPEVPVNRKKLKDGTALLVARLLGLLVAFVGVNLTMRLLSEAWPKLALKKFPFTQGESP